jgi:hypothetical protein
MNTLCIPRHSLALCAALALLVPWIGSLPDIPFGHWHPLLALPHGLPDLPGFLFGLLFMLALNGLAISPVYLAGRSLRQCPLAYWMALAAYLGAVLFGYGTAFRVLDGDGLEFLFPIVFSAMAALCGAAAGWALDRLCRNAALQLWLVRVALAAAVCGALAWSVQDSAGFEARRLAWQSGQQARWQAQAGHQPQDAPALPAPPQPACLGHASADGATRLFSASECSRLPGSTFAANGECLKQAGGSYSWDLRGMNRSCP